MPTKGKKNLTLEKFVTDMVAKLSEVSSLDEDSILIAKEYSCNFFKSGKCPTCNGCDQPDSLVAHCAKDLVRKLPHNPMFVWSQDFNKKIRRDFVAFKDAEIDIGLSCDNCYIRNSCPLFQESSLCAIDWGAGVSKDPKELMSSLINIQYARVRKAQAIELTDGGVPDTLMSNEIDRLTSLLERARTLDQNKFSMTINATGGEAAAAGAGAGGGILSRLFGDAAKKELPPADPTLEITGKRVEQYEEAEIESMAKKASAGGRKRSA